METVREYIAPHLSADTLRRIQALEEERTSGFCPETSYQERLPQSSATRKTHRE